MNWLDRLHRADVKHGTAAGVHRHHPLVRVLGWASELADQPQLVTSCLATATTGIVARNGRLARTGLGMLAAELLATGMKSLIKHRVDRTRPYVPQEGGRYQLKSGGDHASRMNSFPSGHTAGAVAVAHVIGRSYQEHRTAAYTLAAAVAGIQVPRSKHYPSDLAVGAVIGWGAGAIASRLTKSEER